MDSRPQLTSERGRRHRGHLEQVESAAIVDADNLASFVTWDSGEELRVLEGDENSGFRDYRWYSSPRLYSSPAGCSSRQKAGMCDCCEPRLPNESPPELVRLLGREDFIGLFVVEKPGATSLDVLHEKCYKIPTMAIAPEHAVEKICKTSIPKSLARYLIAISVKQPDQDISAVPIWRGIMKGCLFADVLLVKSLVTWYEPGHLQTLALASLRALDCASRIYRQFPSATIPLKLLRLH